MAFRRYKRKSPSYAKKRKTVYRKKRTFRRKVPRLIRDKTMTVRLQLPESFFTTSTLVGLLTSFNLQPNLVTNWNVYATIFDTFIVKSFTYTLQMPFDTINLPVTTAGGAAGALQKAEMYTALDYDSVGTVPSNTEEVRSYANSKHSVGGTTHVRKIKPMILNTIRRSSISNTYVPARMSLLDVATGDIQLAPTILIAMDPTSTTWSIRVDCYVWITFSGNRKC